MVIVSPSVSCFGAVLLGLWYQHRAPESTNATPERVNWVTHCSQPSDKEGSNRDQATALRETSTF